MDPALGLSSSRGRGGATVNQVKGARLWPRQPRGVDGQAGGFARPGDAAGAAHVAVLDVGLGEESPPTLVIHATSNGSSEDPRLSGFSNAASEPVVERLARTLACHLI